jgi:chromosome partitioning protein
MDEEQDYPIPLKAAAEQFGLKRDRLRRAAWAGRLRGVQAGGQWLVRPSEVERFITQGGRQPASPSPEVQRTGPARGGIIAVAIPKGGTGKTTTVLNLGAALAELGERVLLVDADPQASLTVACGVDPLGLKYTLHSAIRAYVEDAETDLSATILHTTAGLDLLPSSITLNLANSELMAATHREHVLEQLLDPLRSRYDWILIDTLPYLGVLVENALVAADDVIIPCQAQKLATESTWLLLTHVAKLRRQVNPRLRVRGILLTQLNPRLLVQRQFAENARMIFTSQAPVFETTIELGTSVQESQALQQTLLSYQPHGPVARAYRALAQEVLRGV